MVKGWWDHAPHMEEDSCAWLACSPCPAHGWAGAIGVIDQVSLDSLSLERKLSGKEVITSYRLIQELLPCCRAGWVVWNSSSGLLAPLCTTGVTLRLSHQTERQLGQRE